MRGFNQSWRRTCFLEPWQSHLTPSVPWKIRSCLSPWWGTGEGEVAHAVFRLPCSSHQALPFGRDKTLRTGPMPIFPESKASQAKPNVCVTSVSTACLRGVCCEVLNSPLPLHIGCAYCQKRQTAQEYSGLKTHVKCLQMSIIPTVFHCWFSSLSSSPVAFADV